MSRWNQTVGDPRLIQGEDQVKASNAGDQDGASVDGRSVAKMVEVEGCRTPGQLKDWKVNAKSIVSNQETDDVQFCLTLKTQ